MCPFAPGNVFTAISCPFRALASVHEAYTAQLIREIEAQGACCREYQVKTVFIGGGTPSVMEPCLISGYHAGFKPEF